MFYRSSTFVLKIYFRKNLSKIYTSKFAPLINITVSVSIKKYSGTLTQIQLTEKLNTIIKLKMS